MYDEYREKIKEINEKVERIKEVYPNTYAFCGDMFVLAEEYLYYTKKFSKELKAYVKTLPTDLTERIDTKEFEKFNVNGILRTYGDEDEGWYTWGPSYEIITTFGYYYQSCNDFDEAYKKTLEFYEKTAPGEWFEGRHSFLGRLILS